VPEALPPDPLAMISIGSEEVVPFMPIAARRGRVYAI
jgi:hypothetical protein